MAGKEVYPEELPRKKAKKEARDEKVDESILDNIVNLSEEVPRLFEVRSNIRREPILDSSKSSLLDKSATPIIDKFCVAHDLERKAAIQEIMESAMKEFYSRILDKVNYLQVKQPEEFVISNKPKDLIKGENKTIIHNQRKVCENPGCVKETQVIKLLGLGKWKLRTVPDNI